MNKLKAIVAVDKNFGIGKNGTLPWRLSGDMKYFKAITTETSNPDAINAVIMGRKTWESIPDRFKPLPGRLNIVLSRNQHYPLPEGTLHKPSLRAAVDWLNEKKNQPIESAFLIGGGEIYKQALEAELVDKIYMTHIEKDFKCDTFFLKISNSFSEISSSATQTENQTNFRFAIYKHN